MIKEVLFFINKVCSATMDQGKKKTRAIKQMKQIKSHKHKRNTQI